MPRGHRLAAKLTIGPADLAGEPYISFSPNDYGRFNVDNIFEEAGISRIITLETPYTSITCALVAQGLGIAIVNPIAAQDYQHMGVVTRPFRPSIRHVATLIYPKGRSKDRLVSSFVEILKLVTLEDQRALASPTDGR
jgi:DNA-binding transcriptional LysR family regulator